MPLSPPKVVAPLTACSDRVRVQGQLTGASVSIYASPNTIYDEVFSGQATGPDETFVLTRRLKAGETVFAKQAHPGEASGPFSSTETVGPEPDPNELAPITADAHLHVCGRCGAFGNGLPGAEVIVTDQQGAELGRAVVDAETGAARVRFRSILTPTPVFAQQHVCGKSGPVSACPTPDQPAPMRHLSAPVLKPPLRACERAVWVGEVSEGAMVRVFRDGQEDRRSCFDYPNLWFRLGAPLKEGEKIKVDQSFPECELASAFSEEVMVQPAATVPAPLLLGPFCKGTVRIGVGGLSFGAHVQIVQTFNAAASDLPEALAQGGLVADAEAWGAVCDVPLIEPLDPVRGRFLFAFQALCDQTSPASQVRKISTLRSVLPAPRVIGPLSACERVVRVAGIQPGAWIEVVMTCAQAPHQRTIAARQIHDAVADILVSPSLVVGERVFVRQSACAQTSESDPVSVDPVVDLAPPTVEDCGDHLHVSGARPGALVEVYVGGSFFRSGRSGSSVVHISLQAPLPAGSIIKARQILCAMVSGFGPERIVRDDVEKRRLAVVPIGWPGFPAFASERLCQLTGTQDPEGRPILNNCQAAGIVGTDLGIVLDHDTGDGRLYFFFGDTVVDQDRVDDFPQDGDCMARTSAHDAGSFGPTLDFLHDVDDGDPVPRVFGVHDLSQGAFEVPTGGFSHNGKLYVFAATDHYTEAPRTVGLFKDENFMGRSVLASAATWRDMFNVVPGHEAISDRSREATAQFKFINIAPWKVANAEWPHLPSNAATSRAGLLMLASGRYRESRLCLAYVPLPDAGDPSFAEWRYLAGYGPRDGSTGACGAPQWSARQDDAIFLWDDSAFFPGPSGPTPRNRGVVGELSFAWLPEIGLWVALYAGGKLRSAEHPWGPWSDPIDLFDFQRDHADRTDPADTRPRYIEEGGGTYGPYIVPRFTKHEPLSGNTEIVFTLSVWKPYQVMLLRTTVNVSCGYRERPTCGGT